MIIVLRNEFHNTEARVRVGRLPIVLNPRRTKQVLRMLCNQRDCKCGRIRGKQEVEAEWFDSDRLELRRRESGGW